METHNVTSNLWDTQFSPRNHLDSPDDPNKLHMGAPSGACWPDILSMPGPSGDSINNTHEPNHLFDWPDMDFSIAHFIETVTASATSLAANALDCHPPAASWDSGFSQPTIWSQPVVAPAVWNVA